MMKKTKPNLPLGIGLLFFAASQLIGYVIDIPEPLHIAFLLANVVLVFIGMIFLFHSPEMKNSRIRKFKLRLIGKEEK